MKKFSSLMAAVVTGASLMGGTAFAQAAEPELVEVAAPEYPRGAERRELEGYVTVRYNVTETGEVANVEVVEQTLPREMLYLAEEAFFTGTAAEITPIRSVDQRMVGAGRRVGDRIQRGC